MKTFSFIYNSAIHRIIKSLVITEARGKHVNGYSIDLCNIIFRINQRMVDNIIQKNAVVDALESLNINAIHKILK